MTKMNYMELYSFTVATGKGLASRKELLNKAQKSMNAFAHSKGGLTGNAADGIANYISEVHNNGLQTMLEQLMQRFGDLVKLYFASYTGVDQGGNDFYLATADYEAINRQVDSYRTDVAIKIKQFNQITRSVSDIVDSGIYVQQANGVKTKVDDLLDSIKTGIKKQKQSWQTYEAEQVQKFAELDDMINAISRLISQYSNQTLPQFTGYQKGAFAEKISGKTQQVITTLQNNSYRDRDLVKNAEQQLNAAKTTYKHYLERLEKEQNMRDGRSQFYTDLAFMAIGVGITIMSGGVAVPALLAFGMALDGLNLYEDYTKMKSGEKYGTNLLKSGLMQLGLNRESTEGVYTLLSLAGGVAGSKGAFNSLAKEGHLVSNGIKTKPLLQNSKQVWQDSTSFKNLFNFADDSKVIGSNAKKTMQALELDGSAIKNNVKIAKENKLLLEGIVPKLTKNASGKVIAKTYAKETVKQVTFAGVKDAVVSPVADSLTNTLVSNDTSSVKYKVTDKIIGNVVASPVKTAINVRVGMWRDNLTGGKITKQIENRARIRDDFSDRSWGTELDNSIDLIRDMKELYKW